MSDDNAWSTIFLRILTVRGRFRNQVKRFCKTLIPSLRVQQEAASLATIEYNEFAVIYKNYYDKAGRTQDKELSTQPLYFTFWIKKLFSIVNVTSTVPELHHKNNNVQV